MAFPFKEIGKEVLDFWRKNRIFERSVAGRPKNRQFVFYEGPPTANAPPGLHHVLARVFKDIICRYKTMQGFRVERKAGWDTHGLPVELQIEKKLGFQTKQDIEKYGIAKFNEQCRQAVWQYVKDWEDLTEKIGFWLDMKKPYITYNPDYMESVWFILKKIWEKGLLYEDFKVVPWCPRCGTALSSHEVAQGYEKATESAIYVKFQMPKSKFQTKSKIQNPNFVTYLLSWTTTPWTLPGNVALTVHPKIKYALVKIANESYILAKNRIGAVLGKNAKIIKEFSGKELVGASYLPLFDIKRLQNENSYKVYAADFVAEDEGTGIVHTAVMYGADDFELGSKVGLPKHHTVDQQGRFTKEAPAGLAGKYVKDKQTESLIINYLFQNNLLLTQENYTHDYPFCWRCETPLLYYAKHSWFIRMSKLKSQLLKNNAKINWIPAHIKQGRFGEWLREIKDWALSRERYWGTPLPLWQCRGCHQQLMIGSVGELKAQKFTTNQYFLIRHGSTVYQARGNPKNVLLYREPAKDKTGLTERGKQEIRQAAAVLKKARPDLIFSSDLVRAKQTAQILSRELGLKVIYDKNLRDIDFGTYHGQTIAKYQRNFPNNARGFSQAPPGGESRLQAAQRVYSFVKKLDRKHLDKKIVIVSHGFPIRALQAAFEGLGVEGLQSGGKFQKNPEPGRVIKSEFRAIPFNTKGEVDLHRPYIDEVEFLCQKCKSRMKRVSEVIDVWFDSGSMPFAQKHWPFSKISAKGEVRLRRQNSKPPQLFPADYICEAVDQSRGWFYTLHAISTLLDFGPSYENVISLGHVLDEKGEKMSKSKGNVVDPWQILQKYGADALRWYFFTVNQPGDAKLFTEKEVQESLRKFVMTLWNSFIFWDTYAPNLKLKMKNEEKNEALKFKTKNLLDHWIFSRLNQLVGEVGELLNNYDITAACRKIETFVIDDLSQWYIRRSRHRFQHPESKNDFEAALSTLSTVLLAVIKLTAPFVPFVSERIYQSLKPNTKIQMLNKTRNLKSKFKNFLSVHLSDWPKINKKLINPKLEQQMAWARYIASLGLQARAKAGIKVRQPLSQLKIKGEKLKVNKELLAFVKDEVNVKEVIFDKKLKTEVKLNTKITSELKAEGLLRELVRQIQVVRKEAGLAPADLIILQLAVSPAITQLLHRSITVLSRQVNAAKIVLQSAAKLRRASKLELDGQEIKLALRKV